MIHTALFEILCAHFSQNSIFRIWRNVHKNEILYFDNYAEKTASTHNDKIALTAPKDKLLTGAAPMYNGYSTSAGIWGSDGGTGGKY
jgi:hypothetical protein